MRNETAMKFNNCVKQPMKFILIIIMRNDKRQRIKIIMISAKQIKRINYTICEKHVEIVFNEE